MREPKVIRRALKPPRQVVSKRALLAEASPSDLIMSCLPSLDGAVMEEEMVSVRGASEGKFKVDFVRVKAVSEPDATNIAEAVCSIMDSKVSTDWKNKPVALTTDGASVMTGRANVLGIHGP